MPVGLRIRELARGLRLFPAQREWVMLGARPWAWLGFMVDGPAWQIFPHAELPEDWNGERDIVAVAECG